MNIFIWFNVVTPKTYIFVTGYIVDTGCMHIVRMHTHTHTQHIECSCITTFPRSHSLNFECEAYECGEKLTTKRQRLCDFGFFIIDSVILHQFCICKKYNVSKVYVEQHVHSALPRIIIIIIIIVSPYIFHVIFVQF